MAMTRRDFIARLMGGAAFISLSPLLDLAPIEVAPSTIEIVGGITSSSYTFWRNMHPAQLAFMARTEDSILWAGAQPSGLYTSGTFKGLQALIDGQTKTV